MKKGAIHLLCLLTVLLQYSTGVLAQKEGKQLADSLVKELPKMQEDTNKVNLLNNLSFACYADNPDEGVRYGMQSADLANELSFKTGTAKAYRSIGINYENKGDYPKALNYFFRALQINEEMKDSLSMAKTISTIGIIYDDQKDYPKALSYYDAGLKIFTRLGDKPNRAINLGNIALVYSGMNNVSKALEYDSLALNAFEQTADKDGIARSMGNLGIHNLAAGNLPKSLEYSLTALKLYTEEGDDKGVALTYGNIGEVYYVAATDTNAGIQKNGLFATDKKALLQKAADNLNRSLAIAKAAGYLNIVCDNGTTLARTQEKLGDYKEALNSYRTYTELRDSVFNEESRVRVQNLITRRELDLKDKQIELDKLAVEKKRNERVFYIIGIALLLVVLGIIARDHRTQKKLNNTITKLVNEQEITIQQRTEALTQTNKKLLDLIQFNAHNIREPLTRIMGTMMLREAVTDHEFMEEYWPMMEQSVNDLDNTLKKVIETAEKENI